MSKENVAGKRKISPLDVFVIVLLVLCVAGVALRIYVGTDGILPDITKETGEYAVSFEVTGISSAVSTYLAKGEPLYSESGELIGTVREGITVTPAVIFVEDADGKYVQTYSGADNGDASLVDVRGTFTVEGHETGYGFLANGKTYLAPNYVTEMHTRNATFSVKITDIASVGN